MQVVSGAAAMLTFATFFGGWEIVLILALVLILLGAGNLPRLGRGLRQGLFEFRRATKEVADEIDDEGIQAGRSVGGIHGKPALQALTPDNRVAERYPPDRKEPQVMRLLVRLWSWIRRTARVILPG